MVATPVLPPAPNGAVRFEDAGGSTDGTHHACDLKISRDDGADVSGGAYGTGFERGGAVHEDGFTAGDAQAGGGRIGAIERVMNAGVGCGAGGHDAALGGEGAAGNRKNGDGRNPGRSGT